MSASEELIVSQTAIAKAFEVTSRTIRNFVAEGMPGELRESRRKVKYDLAQAVPWYVERKQAEVAPEVASPIEAAKLRKEELEVAKREMEMERRLGNYVRAEDLDEIVDELSEAYRTAVSGLPGLFSSDVVGIRNKRQATKRLREMSEHLIAEMERIAADLEES